MGGGNGLFGLRAKGRRPRKGAPFSDWSRSFSPPCVWRRGLFFQTAGSAGLVASSSRMVRLRRGRCAVHCLTSARNVRPLIVRVHCW